MKNKKHQHYYLGIDGGASKTEIWCADEKGKIVGKGMSGPTNLSAGNKAQVQKNLQLALMDAVKDLPRPVIIKRAVIGLAGFDTPDEQASARKVFIPVFDIVDLKSWTIVNDTVISLASGSNSKDAIVVISGTGSNCFGHNSKGKVAHAGGMDFLLSDEGSGYAIGREVLRAAVRSYDGRGTKTLLEEMVLEHFNIKTITQLKGKVYNPPLEKHKVGRLATLCTQAANKGDDTAQKIFDDAVSDLVELVQTVMKKLSLLDSEFDLVMTGGLIEKEIFNKPFLKKLRSVNDRFNPIFPDKKPVSGAVSLAMKGGSRK